MVKNHKDFKLGIGLIAFCLFCLLYLIPRQVGGFTEPESLLPVISVIVILALGIALVTGSLRGGPAVAVEHPEAAHTSPFTLMSVVIVMIGLAWVMDVIGFLLSSSLAMVILFIIFGVKNIKHIVLTTSITVAVLYLAFAKLFVSPLPIGTLIERLME